MAPKDSFEDVFDDITETELKKRYTVVEDEFEDHLEETPFKANFSIKDTLEFLRNFDYSQLIWRRVLKYMIIHLFAFHGLYLLFTFQIQWRTCLAILVFAQLGGLCFGMVVHRMWVHKSFKTNSLVKFLGIIGSNQYFYMSVYDYIRYHRAHHKFSDTDGDYANIKRGLFFAHIGNQLMRDKEETRKALAKCDCSDAWEDPFVRIEHQYYNLAVFLFCILLPVSIPMYFWNESLYISFVAMFGIKVCLLSHVLFAASSLTHTIGNRPYDKSHSATDNLFLAVLMAGEGWHNYHHVFPYDYRSSNLSWRIHYNPNAMVIEMLAKLGWCWDLKIASPKLVKARIDKCGDGSYYTSPLKEVDEINSFENGKTL